MSWKPEVSVEEASVICGQLYGITTESVEALPGYDDANFCVRTTDGNKYTLKFSHFGESYGFLDMQNQSMEWLVSKGLCAPAAVPSVSGSLISQVTLKRVGGGEEQSYVRLLKFIEGKTLLHADPSAQLYRSVGVFGAKLDLAWTGFSHPFVRTDYAWDIKNLMNMKQYLPSLTKADAGAAQIKLVEDVFDQFEREILPLLGSIPSGVIHCDGNALNIIVDEEHNEVKAFIDFGDVSHTNLVNELAILMAYAMIDKIRKNEAAAEADKGVLEVGGCVVEGYSEVRPLSGTEMRLLPCLIKARLVTSVLFSAHTLLQRPQDKDYLTVDARPGWVVLQLLASRSDQELIASFRTTASLPAAQG